MTLTLWQKRLPPTRSATWTTKPISNWVKEADADQTLHQVTAVSNGKLTFAEPIMRKVEAKYNRKIKKYPHYENVGVEDLTFQGKAVKGFENITKRLPMAVHLMVIIN